MEGEPITVERRRELARQAASLLQSDAFLFAVADTREWLRADWENTKATEREKREELHAEMRALRKLLGRLTALRGEGRVDHEE